MLLDDDQLCYVTHSGECDIILSNESNGTVVRDLQTPCGSMLFL